MITSMRSESISSPVKNKFLNTDGSGAIVDAKGHSFSQLWNSVLQNFATDGGVIVERREDLSNHLNTDTPYPHNKITGIFD